MAAQTRKTGEKGNMILVGLNMEWMNCVGASEKYTLYFEAHDVHEAAVKTLKSTRSNPWQGRWCKGGEFHDTERNNTWSVDSGGHTLKDYRRETATKFKQRWGGDKL